MIKYLRQKAFMVCQNDIDYVGKTCSFLKMPVLMF